LVSQKRKSLGGATMPNTCSSCKFWEFVDRDLSDTPWGTCRKEPPKSSSFCALPSRNLWVGQWPGVKARDWCASYESTEQAASFVLGTPLIVERK
jgi:hypothetical protein